jgi:alkanesulfonate monooxygenase SsuD/methylene tetrahydromethanopterin reductase-like flavin-dependent oxidoreductase (luciferase family)
MVPSWAGIPVRRYVVRFGLFDIMQVLAQTSSQQAYAEHLSVAELADEVGLDYYFSAERHFMPLYRTPAPSVWLGAVAARTRRIRIGALAYILPLHNPVRLAEEVSMLDHLSGGRMEVGAGLGHRPQELVSLGVDPESRHALMMEGLVLMLRAWRGETFDHPGDVYQYQGLYVEAPVQRPHPPLWYAGNDPAAAGWAARNGLSLAVGFQPNAPLRAPAMAYREAERDAGEDPTRRLALMRHLYVADSDDQAMEEMVHDVMAIGAHFAASPAQLQGTGHGQPRSLTRADAEAEVQQMLANDVVIGGGPETCAGAIADTARQLDLDVFLANPFPTGVDVERVRRTVRLYAERVRPLVRERLGDADSS